MEIPIVNIAAVAHLIILGLWGGIVTTEVVLEMYHRKHPEAHMSVIKLHFWIDLLVELPLIICMAASGIFLLTLIETITWLHIVKISLGSAAIISNLYCVYAVVKRARVLDLNIEDSILFRLSNVVFACGATGIPIGVIVFGMGIWLGYHRIVEYF